MVKEVHRFNKLTPSEFIGGSTDARPTKSIQFPEDNILPLSEFTEVDGAGNIVDFWIHDGTQWNH